MTYHLHCGSATEALFIKPLHGINNGPLALYAPPKGYAEAGIPFCRLHDTGGPFGGAHYVDIPNVFPDFNADPSDPESYDFAFTDALLRQLHAAGTEPFYRLGITIENNWRIKAYHTAPPKDYEKWAEICLGIIRHYNEGWANGLRLGIRYWEIWNEPENPPMWSGTQEEFFALYITAARRIKSVFPQLKVGGYGSCGFYAITRKDATPAFKVFSAWFEAFLNHLTAPVTKAPLDFFSWHLYTNDPEEIVIHARHVKEQLLAKGLTDTECIFNEWNYIPGKGGQQALMNMKEAPGAAFIAAAFCLMQESPIDKSMYYDGKPTSNYCGIYYYPTIFFTHAYYSFLAWNQLYQLRKMVRLEGTLPSKCYAAAATNEAETALLIVNNGDTCRTMTLEIEGPPLKYGRMTSQHRLFEPFIPSTRLTLPSKSVALLTTTFVEDPEKGENPQRKNTMIHGR